MRGLFLLILFWVSLGQQAQAQTRLSPRDLDYTKADSLALHFPKKKYKKFSEIAGPLTQHLTTEEEKFRAVFIWITDNIAYSYGNRTANPNAVVVKGKGVCGGYAHLLKAMANSVGVECEVVVGYSKTRVKDFKSKYKKTDHAWNAVKLAGTWYLVDATWASGSYNHATNKFIKDYDGTYFLTDPDFFVKNHLPLHRKWQLLEKPISKAEFKKYPLYYSTSAYEGVTLTKPFKNHLKGKAGQDFTLSFKVAQQISFVNIRFGNQSQPTSSWVKSQDSLYTLTIGCPKKKGTYPLTIFLDGRAAVAYTVKVK